MKKGFTTYTEEEVGILREAGIILHRILRDMEKEFIPGRTTGEIDQIAERMILEGGATPVFKNYKPAGASYPFPASSCISINDEVAHGIPGKRVVMLGDLVSLDIGIRYKGLVVDSAISFGVGELSEKENKLIAVTKAACDIGINQVRAGAHVNDIGKAIEKYVKQNGFSVVGILCGHAVGKKVHDEPFIPHIDMGSKGEKLTEGMVIAIEPHISMGSGRISISQQDDYTYSSDDGAKTAQFEHTILVLKDGFEILT